MAPDDSNFKSPLSENNENPQIHSGGHIVKAMISFCKFPGFSV